MTIEEIQTALGELVAAMVEKGVPEPDAQITVMPRGDKGYSIIRGRHNFRGFDGKSYRIFLDEDFAVCIDKAREYIAALPSPEEVVTREYLTRVASAIDYATENSIADEYVTPLRGVTCAMTENLLTKEPQT